MPTLNVATVQTHIWLNDMQFGVTAPSPTTHRCHSQWQHLQITQTLLLISLPQCPTISSWSPTTHTHTTQMNILQVLADHENRTTAGNQFCWSYWLTRLQWHLSDRCTISLGHLWQNRHLAAVDIFYAITSVCLSFVLSVVHSVCLRAAVLQSANVISCYH